ncbi:MAG: hypothetical protein DWQ36_16770 [Acidobacteria bacterium]|nr:MAG: hypothetical protein DWQ30_14940 [Acidobacteriota bacterium]REK04506.1 MAG: hypothetical protein DWQ36_16770 [Acidobacteriota bacterium]
MSQHEKTSLDNGSPIPAPDGKPSASTARESFEHLLERELQHEAQVRRLAEWGWASALACLMLTALCFFLIRNQGGFVVEAVRAALIVLFGIGSASVVIAMLSSLRWMYRPRTANLTAIERRLASLERLLEE